MLGFYPQIFDYVLSAITKYSSSIIIFPKEFYPYYYVQYFIMVIIEVYFIVRFTIFYQYLNYQSVDTQESLLRNKTKNRNLENLVYFINSLLFSFGSFIMVEFQSGRWQKY